MLRILKRLARPLLLPVLRRLGWRSGRAKPPRIAAHERLAAADVPTKVTIRDDRTLLVNGEPFFPIGLYYARQEIADASGAELRKLRQMGFNVIFFDGDLSAAAELDRIWSAGLYVWYRPPGELYRDYETLKRVVAKFARHPAVLLWEMDDEPAHNGVSLRDTRIGSNIVRRIDPFHPILCNQWLSSVEERDEFRAWSRLADVHGFGVYPVPVARWRERMTLVEEGWPADIRVVGRQVDFFRSITPRDPIIPVLQAFARNSIEDGMAGFPTWEQARFMVYQAVIHGANGLHHFGDVSAANPNLACGLPPHFDEDLDVTQALFEESRRHNAAFWSYYSGVVGEIARMSEVFTAREVAWTRSVSVVSDAPVEWRIQSHDGSPVVLAVNASAERADFVMTALPLRSKRLNVWGEARAIEVAEDGRLRDHLAAYAVRVYSDRPEPMVAGGTDGGAARA